MTDPRPVTLLIAALGGEGGGVLTDWIVSAAEASGLAVQSTSIPGVAQRTGATTYYIEMFPVPIGQLSGKRPVLALAPGVGDVDIVVASELLEAGRAIANGFVTPDRTLLIASLSRVFLTVEKMQLGDGRYDSRRLLAAVEQSSKERVVFDMEAAAKKAGALVSAVMLGAIAGSGGLPVFAEAFEEAIRRDGKAVESNLRGFAAGFEAARADEAGKLARTRKRGARPTLRQLEGRAAALLPPARPFAIEGVRRLAAYQNAKYAQLYLDWLKPVADADARAHAEGRLLAQTARHLAVRMSYEDVIRVAEAKIAPARLRRIEGELGSAGQPYVVTEFLKPGIEELCQVLPRPIGQAIVSYAEKRGWLGKVYFGMELKTTSVWGYLRFWALTKLKRLRPYSLRYSEEFIAIQAWLVLVKSAARLSPELALEVVECARLIKGYGDTWKRGAANYAIIEEKVVDPVLAGRIPVPVGIDAIASARTAALTDPDGESLARTLAAIDAQMNAPVAETAEAAQAAE